MLILVPAAVESQSSVILRQVIHGGRINKVKSKDVRLAYNLGILVACVPHFQEPMSNIYEKVRPFRCASLIFLFSSFMRFGLGGTRLKPNNR